MLRMWKENSSIYDRYYISYGNSENHEPMHVIMVEFTTWDLLHFVRWLYEMYERRLIKPMHIKEVDCGTIIIFDGVNIEDKNFSYYNKQAYLIHRVYDKLKDVENIVDIFNKYY